jgi:prepilin signal peptidase PulO-like enzyme (type II secretory pathway)
VEKVENMWGILIIGAIILSIFDIRSMEIPLPIFLIYAVASLYHANLGAVHIVFTMAVILLGRLAERFEFGFGNGDCYLLAIFSLHLTAMNFLHLLFIASFSGILFAFLTKIFTKKLPRVLPFFPFLTLGLIVVHVFF